LTTRTAARAFGTEVMNVSDDAELERLLRDAHDEDAAVADLDGCVARLLRAREAKIALSRLSAEELRTVLQMRRATLETGRT
jgi:hypothetical protein